MGGGVARMHAWRGSQKDGRAYPSPHPSPSPCAHEAGGVGSPCTGMPTKPPPNHTTLTHTPCTPTHLAVDGRDERSFQPLHCESHGRLAGVNCRRRSRHSRRSRRRRHSACSSVRLRRAGSRCTVVSGIHGRQRLPDAGRLRGGVGPKCPRFQRGCRKRSKWEEEEEDEEGKKNVGEEKQMEGEGKKSFAGEDRWVRLLSNLL